MHLYKFRDFKNTKRILEEQRVAFSAPLKFNDPFDCHMTIQHGFRSDKFDQIFANRLIEDAFQVTHPKNLPPNYVDNFARLRNRRIKFPLENLKNYIANYVRGEKTMLLKQTSEELQKQWEMAMRDLRVFCLAEHYNDLLMWGHYAECHRGAVVGFNRNLFSEESDINLIQVNYSLTLPTIGCEEEWLDLLTRGKTFDLTHAVRMLISTKSKDWSNEREWRYYFSLPIGEGQKCEPITRKIRDDSIVSLHLGMKLDTAEREELIELASTNFPSAKIFNAKKSSSNFELNFEKIP